MSTSFKQRKQQRQQQGAQTGGLGELLTPRSIATSLSAIGKSTSLTRLVEEVFPNAPFTTRILLLGPPGVGKTSILREYAKKEAKELGREFVDLSKLAKEDIERYLPRFIGEREKYYFFTYIPAHVVTEEYVQLPKMVVKVLKEVMKNVKEGGKTREGVSWIVPVEIIPLTYTLEYVPENKRGEIIELIEKYREASKRTPSVRRIEEELMKYLPVGMLFLDEITKGSRYLMERFIQSLTGESQWGSAIPISPLVRIVMAANPPAYDMYARPLPEPVLRRVMTFYVMPTPEEVWDYIQRLMLELGYPPHALPYEIYGFMLSFPQYFIPTHEVTEKAREEFTGYPCPATLVKAAQILGAYKLGMISPETLGLELSATIGPEAARALLEYMLLETPPPQKLLENPELFNMYISEKIGELEEKLNLPKDILSAMLRTKMIINLASYIAQQVMMGRNIDELVDKLRNFLEHVMATNPEVVLKLWKVLKDMLENIGGEASTIFRTKIMPMLSQMLLSAFRKVGGAHEYILRYLRSFTS